MKKYLLGLFAVVLAIGFSAFDTKNVNSPIADVFWYKVSSTGVVTAELGQIPRPQAVQDSGCPDAGAILCARGYTTDLYNVGDNTTPTTNAINKN